MACEGVDACLVATFKPAKSLQGVKADIRRALDMSAPSRANTFLAEPPPTTSQDAYLVDRKFYGSRKPAGQPDKKCIVCGKTGCWSSNHSREEQRPAFDRIAKENGYPQRMRQFILEIEGSPDNVTNDYNLLVDTMPIDDSPREP